jgi:hypothetical protein
MLVILLPNLLYAENKEGISEDIPKKNATKAMLYSLVIPGGGQFYNQKYLKAGIDFAAESILIGYTLHYHIKMNDAYDKYKQNPEMPNYYDEYSRYYEKRQSIFWWFGAVKFMSVVDAFVDAKIYNYEEKKRKIELRFGGDKVSLNYRF